MMRRCKRRQIRRLLFNVWRKARIMQKNTPMGYVAGIGCPRDRQGLAKNRGGKKGESRRARMGVVVGCSQAPILSDQVASAEQAWASKLAGSLLCRYWTRQEAFPTGLHRPIATRSPRLRLHHERFRLSGRWTVESVEKARSS
jgi:hypothetical protein